MDDLRFLPMCKVYPHKIVQFYYNTDKRTYPIEQGLNLIKDRKKAYQGFISKSAQRIIEERLTAWHLVTCAYNMTVNPREQSKQKKLVFITLTLSSKQKHTDIWLKEKLLEQFLKDLKYRFGLKNYFWCAEKQKNGNLHFHLLIDFYIDKDVLRNLWNSVQDYHGYLNDYKKQFGKTCAPSTFVEVVSCHKKAIKYVMKYVVKGSGDMGINGRCWAMSSSIRLLCIPTVFLDSSIDDFINYIHDKVGIKYYNEDFYSVLTFGRDISVLGSGFQSMNIYDKYYSALAKGFYDMNFNDVELNLIVLFYCDLTAYKKELDLLDIELLEYDRVLPLLIT